MNFHKILFVLLSTPLVINSAMAGSVTLSGGGMILPNVPTDISINGGDTEVLGGTITTPTTLIVLSNEYNIKLNGNLYIDYSVFTENTDLIINSSISLKAEGALNIFLYDDTPIMPALGIKTIFQEANLSLDETGDILLFSNNPVTGGIFEATNIFIGNYSSIKPVPLPASLILFLSGVIGLFSVVRRNP